MIKSIVTDSSTSKTARVDDDSGKEKKALVVATRPLKTFCNKPRFFTNDSSGIDMNVSVTFTGTPIGVYDADKTQWTATAISGGSNWDTTNDDTHAKDAVITVVDFTGLSGETITISLNTTSTVITEGVDYSAITSNTVTATNIANAFNSVSGVSASSSGNVVTLIADDDYDIDDLDDNSSSSHLTTSSMCIKATGTTNNNVLELKTTGADVDLSNYTALTGWIYITGWSTQGTKAVELELWLNGSIASNTNKINIGDFVDTGLFNVWQKFTIPFSEFGATSSTIDSIRVKTVDIGRGAPPNYFLDYFRIQESGEVKNFKIKPKLGTWLHVHSFTYSIADEYDGIVEATDVSGKTLLSSFAKLPFNGFLGVSKLSNGLVFKSKRAGIVEESFIVRQLIDITQLPNVDVVGSGSDGVNTWVTIRHTLIEPLILKSEEDDEISFSVSDDLSGLKQLRIVAGCSEENRTQGE
jgi:hypothetical protein